MSMCKYSSPGCRKLAPLILAHHIDIEIDEPLAGNCRADGAHPVRGMAYGTGETCARDMQAVLRPARVRQNISQVMALRAKCIRPLWTQVRSRKEVAHHSAGRRRLAELIISLQNVRINRAVRSIRPSATKFAIVVAAVAVGTEDLVPPAFRSGSILISACSPAGSVAAADCC